MLLLSNTTAIAEVLLDLTASLTLCMPSEPSFIGMSKKVWKKKSFLKPEEDLAALEEDYKMIETDTKDGAPMLSSPTKDMWHSL